MTNKRSAYTLFELVLVLALVVIATSLTFPLAQALFADTHLTAASDMVRTAMLEARSRAVEEGRPFVFSVQQNTGNFQVGPLEMAVGSGAEAPFTSGEMGDQVNQGELPKDIVFCDPQVELQANPSPGEWRKIVFQPDGATGEDLVEISFGKAGGSQMAVRLRGLTGAITTADLPPFGSRP